MIFKGIDPSKIEVIACIKSIPGVMLYNCTPAHEKATALVQWDVTGLSRSLVQWDVTGLSSGRKVRCFGTLSKADRLLSSRASLENVIGEPCSRSLASDHCISMWKMLSGTYRKLPVSSTVKPPRYDLRRWKWCLTLINPNPGSRWIWNTKDKDCIYLFVIHYFLLATIKETDIWYKYGLHV